LQKSSRLNCYLTMFVVMSFIGIALAKEPRWEPCRIHKTIGRFKQTMCSSKDCVIVIEKQNGQEEWFVVYDDDDSSKRANSFYPDSRDVGKLVEIVSDKNRTRGGLEMVISIRSVEGFR
jgi:hypothetical protein